MRHHKKTRILSRTKRGRTALLRNLARSLIIHEGIETSVAKAKELKPYVERLVSASKANSLQSRRLIESRLGGARGARDAVKKLHETLAPRYEKRAGGYTRITRLGRTGKRVMESARIEFV